MIFLDANFFLRTLTRSSHPDTQRMNQMVGDLFRRAEKGEVEVTTSDAVIPEVAFILTAKAHYNLSAGDAAGRLSALLRLRGFKLREKRVVLRALDVWAVNPKLGLLMPSAACQVKHVISTGAAGTAAAQWRNLVFS